MVEAVRTTEACGKVTSYEDKTLLAAGLVPENQSSAWWIPIPPQLQNSFMGARKSLLETDFILLFLDASAAPECRPQ